MKSSPKLAFALAAIAVAVPVAVGCGSSDGETRGTATSAQLEPVKGYLTAHSAELVKQVELLRADADEYYGLARSVDFDYDRLLAEHGTEVEEILDHSKEVFVLA